MPAQHFHLATLETPIGGMFIVWDDDASMRALDWSGYAPRMHRLLSLHYGAEGVGYTVTQRPLPRSLDQPLRAYLAGHLQAIDGIQVQTGGTPFQRQVWTALRQIPAGSTETYAALAARIGRPHAVRAVGHANGANPVGVVVPCHRVIGTNASLTGYGGGLHRKHWLLTHEGVALTRAPPIQRAIDPGH